ncbi:MAG TPA: ring-cleaving dioxygenase [Ktedonobacterales bacterium]|nr:ring-cleaving dioxygenase [Ktedonobacterales bacterium]
MELGGLHHVTAVTGNAPANVAFYTQVLGLRLVKKTVNQDDVSAYHLFYGDAIGHAGTELTFFDWPQAGANRPGTGAIAAIGMRVPDAEALAWWERRFDELGVRHEAMQTRAGRTTLPFSDPEGQRLELIALAEGETGVRAGEPWSSSPVPAEYQLRGLHSVRLLVARLEPTERTLTEVMGFRAAGAYDITDAETGATRTIHRYEVAAGGAGAEVHLAVDPTARRGMVGIGGVHHVAFRTPNDEEHLAWRTRLLRGGLAATQQIDRYYFRSIYFREPGGVLFEIATDGPGFTSDEDAMHLGERLALPPFLEPHRASIEAGLIPLDTTVPAGDAR